MSYLRMYLYLVTDSAVQHNMTVNILPGVLLEQVLFFRREHIRSPSVDGGFRVAHVFSFGCCVGVFCGFVLSSSCVLCTQCCQFLLIVLS